MPAEQGEKKAAFLPFHALNEFMTPDYRLEVIRSVLIALPDLPDSLRHPIDKLTGKLVKIPGFRNSLKAPIPLRIKPTIEAFEKSPNLVAAILSAWAENHANLREKVFTLLEQRKWEVLPIEADRSKLPGFLTIWPQGENFDGLNQAFKETFPEFETSNNDVSLMVVWLSGRLPYQFTETQESASTPSQASTPSTTGTLNG